MSGFPRLNLAGIQVSKQTTQKLSRKPQIPAILKPQSKIPQRTPQRTLQRTPQKTQQTETSIKWDLKIPRRVPKVFMRYRLALLVLSVMVLFFLFFVSSRKVGMLRRIQKVNCRENKGTFVCESKYTSGTMMITTSEPCRKYIYEVNGVPFVHVKDFYKTMMVPASSKLVIRDARPACKLSVHRTTSFYKSEEHNGVVWVTTKKHTQFTMTIKGVQVLEQTPVGLIESHVNGEWVSYRFDPEIPLVDASDVKISGDSSDPIYVYI
jgi:hypothetical protein